MSGRTGGDSQMADTAAATVIGPHGAKVLPSVEVDNYNLELKDDEGFLGDRASRRAFHHILENWRKPLRKASADPFGDIPSDELSRPKLDEMLKEGKKLDAVAVIQSAIEEYAQELSLVVRSAMESRDARCCCSARCGRPVVADSWMGACGACRSRAGR